MAWNLTKSRKCVSAQANFISPAGVCCVRVCTFGVPWNATTGLAGSTPEFVQPEALCAGCTSECPIHRMSTMHSTKVKMVAVQTRTHSKVFRKLGAEYLAYRLAGRRLAAAQGIFREEPSAFVNIPSRKFADQSLKFLLDGILPGMELA